MLFIKMWLVILCKTLHNERKRDINVKNRFKKLVLFKKKHKIWLQKILQKCMQMYI